MKKTAIVVLGAVALGLLAGCGATTRYTPQLRAQGELTLKYDDGFSMEAEGKEVAAGLTWGGLTEYVQCVPMARQHAKSAERYGAAAVTLSWVGAGIGLGSLGSLGGLAVYDKNPDLTAGILGIGVAAAITGVVLAAVGRNMKNDANGHAVDAMNYYNDEVGSYGGTCKKPVAKPPVVEVQPAPTAEPKTNDGNKDTPSPTPTPAPTQAPPDTI